MTQEIEYEVLDVGELPPPLRVPNGPKNSTFLKVINELPEGKVVFRKASAGQEPKRLQRGSSWITKRIKRTGFHLRSRLDVEKGGIWYWWEEGEPVVRAPSNKSTTPPTPRTVPENFDNLLEEYREKAKETPPWEGVGTPTEKE